MNSKLKTHLRWIVVLLSALSAGPAVEADADGNATARTARRTESYATAHKAASRTEISKRSPRRSYRAGRRRRSQSYRSRIARLRPEPQRIAEIQRALAQAGYLRQEATGKWDAATTDAMRRFQQEHGFSATGLPEAKSLMKLGLGPHPLPEDVDSSVTPRASVQPSSAPSASPDAPSDPRVEEESKQ